MFHEDALDLDDGGRVDNEAPGDDVRVNEPLLAKKASKICFAGWQGLWP
jgi:hypothetical protein